MNLTLLLQVYLGTGSKSSISDSEVEQASALLLNSLQGTVMACSQETIGRA